MVRALWLVLQRLRDKSCQGTDAGSSRWSNKLVALSEVLLGCQNQPVKNAMQLAL
jgi:hypothetical protein